MPMAPMVPRPPVLGKMGLRPREQLGFQSYHPQLTARGDQAIPVAVLEVAGLCPQPQGSAVFLRKLGRACSQDEDPELGLPKLALYHEVCVDWNDRANAQ